MLIKEEQFQSKNNILEKLNEAVYLTQEESTIYPTEITVRENSSIDCNTVMFEDVLAISNQYECSLNEAIEKIAEANDVPSCLLAVDLKEDMAILYPEVVDEMYQVVISPISDKDPVGVWVETVVNEAIEQDDESLLEGVANSLGNALIAGSIANSVKDAYTANKYKEKLDKLGGKKYGAKLGMFKDPEAINKSADYLDSANTSRLMFTTGVGLKIGSKAADKIEQVYDNYKNKPKNVVAKVIAKLRKMYSGIKDKLEKKPGILKKDSKAVATLKKVGAKILQVIDKLMRAMQTTANSFSS